jgi:hypothetical protein
VLGLMGRGPSLPNPSTSRRMWLQKGIKGGQAKDQPNHQENIFFLVLVVVLFIFLYPILVESTLAIPVGLLTYHQSESSSRFTISQRHYVRSRYR